MVGSRCFDSDEIRHGITGQSLRSYIPIFIPDFVNPYLVLVEKEFFLDLFLPSSVIIQEIEQKLICFASPEFSFSGDLIQLTCIKFK